MKKYERKSVYFSLKETNFKSRKKHKNHWQVRYHRQLEEKNFVKFRALYFKPETTRLLGERDVN